MSKLFLIAIFMILCSFFAFAQSEEIEFDEDNIYYKALLAMPEARSREYKGIIEHENLSNVVIYNKQDGIELPKEVGGFQIEYLETSELEKNLKITIKI